MNTPNNIIWKPEDHAWTKSCHVANFMQEHGFEDFSELRNKSTQDVEWFWDAAMKDMDLSWSHP